jgi:hypothetical protein
MALQAVTGSRLSHQFWPENKRLEDTNMTVRVAKENEQRDEELDGSAQPSNELHKMLEAACRKNGYRKLELESCHFSHTDRGFTNQVFGKPSEKETGYEVDSVLDTESGSITMFEANV